MQRPSSYLIRYLRPRNYLLFISWNVKKTQILLHSKRLKYKLRNANQKSLFLDCGSNIGQGFEFFRKYYPLERFDFVLFEPNPHCFKILEQKYFGFCAEGVTLVNAAVGVEEAEIDFFGLGDTQGGIYSVGGSILPEHNSGMYTTPQNSSIKVTSINFTDYLRNLIEDKKYSAIILKLDIEGGEYQILDSLEENELLGLFETIYVEFHSQYMSKEFSNLYKTKEQLFLALVKKTKTRVIKWI
jgi:FkbM family methyltransferase